MSNDNDGLYATAEAFVYVAMTRPMVFFQAFHVAIAVEMLLAASTTWGFDLGRSISESRRAHSNHLPLLHLRVIIHAFQEFAEGCKCRETRKFRKYKGPSVPSRAYCCRVSSAYPAHCSGGSRVLWTLRSNCRAIQYLRRVYRNVYLGSFQQTNVSEESTSEHQGVCVHRDQPRRIHC
jgi:hypothetical protein